MGRNLTDELPGSKEQERRTVTKLATMDKKTEATNLVLQNSLEIEKRALDRGQNHAQRMLETQKKHLILKKDGNREKKTVRKEDSCSNLAKYMQRRASILAPQPLIDLAADAKSTRRKVDENRQRIQQTAYEELKKEKEKKKKKKKKIAEFQKQTELCKQAILPKRRNAIFGSSDSQKSLIGIDHSVRTSSLESCLSLSRSSLHHQGCSGSLLCQKKPSPHCGSKEELSRNHSLISQESKNSRSSLTRDMSSLSLRSSIYSSSVYLGSRQSSMEFSSRESLPPLVKREDSAGPLYSMNDIQEDFADQKRAGQCFSDEAADDFRKKVHEHFVEVESERGSQIGVVFGNERSVCLSIDVRRSDAVLLLVIDEEQIMAPRFVGNGIDLIDADDGLSRHI
eukprot:Nk52_evm54s236 gene=Nk52_evmTU54s236